MGMLASFVPHLCSLYSSLLHYLACGCANTPGKGFVLLVGSFISSLEVEGTRYHVNFKTVGCHNL